MVKKYMANGDEQDIDECDLNKIQDRFSYLEGKSEEEIYLEIVHINEEIEKEMNYEEYESLFQKLKNIRILLSDEQNEKLDILLKKIKQN